MSANRYFFSLGTIMRSAPCQTGLFKGKTPLWIKPVWLFIRVAKELTQWNDLMHLLSFPAFFFLSPPLWNVSSEVECTDEAVHEILLQDGVTCTLAFLLLNFYPKSQLSKNKYNRASYSDLTGILPQRTGQGRKIPLQLLQVIFPKEKRELEKYCLSKLCWILCLSFTPSTAYLNFWVFPLWESNMPTVISFVP